MDYILTMSRSYTGNNLLLLFVDIFTGQTIAKA